MKYYAGFWKRLVAAALDTIIVLILYFILAFFIGICFGIFGISADLLEDSSFEFIFSVLLVVIYWLYHVVMESSAKQATLGKQATKIYVTDMNGKRISFARAAGRNVIKVVSSLFTFGILVYLVAAFTEKNQALHDIFAGTLVIKDK
ncbi:MAG: RDD family protein [Nostocales cyanobacterium 94392]|nr:RDD family protein [Nostocales cyanobacterium 94392]